MGISYRKLFDKMDILGMTQTDLQRNIKCSSNTIGKMKRNEYISMSNLEKICNIFDCQISDIVEIVND